MKFKITITKWYIFLLIIATIETACFGWNGLPGSGAELFCDVTILTVGLVGAVVIGKRDSKKEKNERQ